MRDVLESSWKSLKIQPSKWLTKLGFGQSKSEANIRRMTVLDKKGETKRQYELYKKRKKLLWKYYYFSIIGLCLLIILFNWTWHYIAHSNALLDSESPKG